jgi:hypothetical protein
MSLESTQLLPDDEFLADALYVVLDQHIGRLDDVSRCKFQERLREGFDQYAPAIRDIVRELTL